MKVVKDLIDGVSFDPQDVPVLANGNENQRLRDMKWFLSRE